MTRYTAPFRSTQLSPVVPLSALLPTRTTSLVQGIDAQEVETLLDADIDELLSLVN
jgi:hypothetical protein